MTPRAASNKPPKPGASDAERVVRFLASLEHPRKREILAVRQIILAADPRIGEGIKWNAPSFRTSEYFATIHLRAKDGVQVIFHRGAKARAGAGPSIEDPASLLEWLGQERASAKFRDLKQIEASRSAFTTIIQQWIAQV